jgi:hypothetical protein
MSKHKFFISVHSEHSSEAGGKEIAVLNLVANFGCGYAAPCNPWLPTSLEHKRNSHEGHEEHQDFWMVCLYPIQKITPRDRLSVF